MISKDDIIAMAETSEQKKFWNIAIIGFIGIFLVGALLACYCGEPLYTAGS